MAFFKKLFKKEITKFLNSKNIDFELKYKNQVIGKNNQLIWHLPKDMKFFMDTTMNTVVIMGRKNYESIPKKYRPLKNRKNVIMTRNKSYKAENCVVVNSIDESLKFLNNVEKKEVFVIGGGEIYKKFLEKELTKWLNSKEIAKIPGSKSIEEEALEKATSVAMKNLTKAAAVKALTGIPKAKSTPKKGDSKRKGKKPASARRARAAVPRVAKVKKSEISSILRSIAIINKELPDTVRKNMQSPQLENRTGRFAESVKLTDVVQTPKGYPSFGYTYQRNPYQVFENGSSGNWSNGERDPRQLIDKSIREIAAQFAIGRFYTRRV